MPTVEFSIQRILLQISINEALKFAKGKYGGSAGIQLLLN